MPLWILNNSINADGHSEKIGPELEYFGTLSYADITRINDYKRNFIADIQVGTLTLANGDKGKVASPCADYGNVQKERTLDLDVKCSITMEDGSELFIYYGGKQIMDKQSDQLIKDGKKNKVLNKKINSSIYITMIHGQKDEVVPVVFSRYVLRLFNKAKKKILIVKNGDHSLSDQKPLKKIMKELDIIVKNVI